MSKIIKRQGACLFFPIGARCGGAERRLIRIFGTLSEEHLHAVKIYIHDIGMTESVKKDIDGWSHNRAEYYQNIIQIVYQMAKARLKWICIASLGKKTVFMFLVGALLGYRRMFLSVHHRSSMLEFSSRGAEKLFNVIVQLSNQVDSLYPNSVSGLEKRYPNKTITLTPGAFTDMRKFHVASKEKMIVFASTLVAGKGLEMLLAGLLESKLILEEKGYTCRVCGMGVLYGMAEEYIVNNDLDSLVTLTGHVDTSEFLPRASIFCSLQAVTNYPSQSLLEAMASGCFCIVTNCGESSMMIDDSFGVLVEENTHAFAEALKHAISICGHHMPEISRNARERVNRDFTLEKSLQHYENLLSEGTEMYEKKSV